MHADADLRQVGPFTVTGVLGAGTMATVYRAVQPAVNRVVALKVLPTELARNPEAVRRFAVEAETAANLNHPHIVRVWEASVSVPPHYIALQHLGGGSLEDRLRQRRLGLGEAVRVVTLLLHALDYAHARGIVHRDIKPANILFDEQGEPYLTDFGIARRLDRPTSTVYGVPFGTPTYMSPEQARGMPVDGRSDLFSLAMILYEMLAGRPPFVNEDPLVTMHQIVHAKPPPLSEYGAGVPRAVEAVLARALARDAARRYASGAEFAGALRQAASVGGAPALRRAAPDAPGAPDRSKRWLQAALGIVVAAIVCVAVAARLSEPPSGRSNGHPPGPGPQPGDMVLAFGDSTPTGKLAGDIHPPVTIGGVTLVGTAGIEGKKVLLRVALAPGTPKPIRHFLLVCKGRRPSTTYAFRRQLSEAKVVRFRLRVPRDKGEVDQAKHVNAVTKMPPQQVLQQATFECVADTPSGTDRPAAGPKTCPVCPDCAWEGKAGDRFCPHCVRGKGLVKLVKAAVIQSSELGATQ